MAKKLHEKVLACQNQLYKKELLINEISEEVYNYPQIWDSFTEDMRTEFYLNFYPRIEGLIYKYRINKEYKFDSYLKHNLKLFKYTFIKRQKIKSKQNYILAQEAYYEEIDRVDNCDEQIPEHNMFFLNLANLLPCEPGTKIFKGKALKNRYLLLVLYYSYHVSEQEILKLSEYIDICPALFLTYYKRIKKSFNNSYELKLKELFNKHNNSYFRKKMNQLELHYEIDTEKRDILKNREQFWGKRYNNLQNKISALEYPKPTHDLLSMITGIKRGTVSSSIHYLKKSLIKYKKAIKVVGNNCKYYKELL